MTATGQFENRPGGIGCVGSGESVQRVPPGHIAYDRGAAPELIRHGRDGFLIPYRCFAQALDHLESLADDPARIGDMGRSGRARAEQVLSPREFAATLNGIYREILQVWAAPERRPASQAPKHR